MDKLTHLFDGKDMKLIETPHAFYAGYPSSLQNIAEHLAVV